MVQKGSLRVRYEYNYYDEVQIVITGTERSANRHRRPHASPTIRDNGRDPRQGARNTSAQTSKQSFTVAEGRIISKASSDMDPDAPVSPAPASPPIWRWVVSFLAVGACWGLTTPFMRRAAMIRDQQPKAHRPYLTSDAPWLKRKFWSILYAVLDLLKNPAYAVPLLLNVTGSVWFFLLIGQAGEMASL